MLTLQESKLDSVCLVFVLLTTALYPPHIGPIQKETSQFQFIYHTLALTWTHAKQTDHKCPINSSKIIASYQVTILQRKAKQLFWDIMLSLIDYLFVAIKHIC